MMQHGLWHMLLIRPLMVMCVCGCIMCVCELSGWSNLNGFSWAALPSKLAGCQSIVESYTCFGYVVCRALFVAHCMVVTFGMSIQHNYVVSTKVNCANLHHFSAANLKDFESDNWIIYATFYQISRLLCWQVTWSIWYVWHTSSFPLALLVVKTACVCVCVCVCVWMRLILCLCRTQEELNSEHQGVGCCWSQSNRHISATIHLLQQQCTSGCDLPACPGDWFQWNHCKWKETKRGETRKWHSRYLHANPLYCFYYVGSGLF